MKKIILFFAVIIATAFSCTKSTQIRNATNNDIIKMFAHYGDKVKPADLQYCFETKSIVNRKTSKMKKTFEIESCVTITSDQRILYKSGEDFEEYQILEIQSGTDGKDDTIMLRFRLKDLNTNKAVDLLADNQGRVMIFVWPDTKKILTLYTRA